MFGPVPIVCFDLSTVIAVGSCVVAALLYGALSFTTARKSAGNRVAVSGKPMDGSHALPAGLVLEQEERGRCVTPVSGFLCSRGRP